MCLRLEDGTLPLADGRESLPEPRRRSFHVPVRQQVDRLLDDGPVLAAGRRVESLPDECLDRRTVGGTAPGPAGE